MAASRLPGVAAACVILLAFAAEDRKSHWSGRIQAAIVICQQIFRNFGANNFLLKNPFKKCFKIVFLSALELQFPTPLCVVLLCFATQSLQIAL